MGRAIEFVSTEWRDVMTSPVLLILLLVALCGIVVYLCVTGGFRSTAKSTGQSLEDLKPLPELVQWYQEAAAQGDIESQFLLASCYFYGIGVKKDKAEAVKWFRIVANRGDADAQRRMGDCYYYGEGVDVSEKEALKWYRKAAKNGNDFSQAFLGKCYFFGIGTPVNASEAIKWYIEAAKQDDKESIMVLKRLGINPLFAEDIDPDNLQDWIQHTLHKLLGIKPKINQEEEKEPEE